MSLSLPVTTEILCRLAALLMVVLPWNEAHANVDPMEEISPSFDCKRAATQVEKKVCESTMLSGLDVWLAHVYGIALKKENSADLRARQRAWLKRRQTCLDNTSNYTFGGNGLMDCYVDRIHELMKQYDIRPDKAFYTALARRMGIRIPDAFENKAEEFVFFQNLDGLMEGFFDNHCMYNPMVILHYDSPLLVTTINGSTVCGGTSHAVSARGSYCEAKGEFVPGSIWTCRDKSLTEERFLFQHYLAHSFGKYAQAYKEAEGSNIVIDYLYTLPMHSLAEPGNAAGYSRIFNENFVAFFSGKVDFIAAVLAGHEDDALEVVDGFECTRKAIMTTEGWEQTLKHHVPGDWMGNYWYGRQFKGCEEYDVKIPGQWYTYKELYTEWLRRLYLAGGYNKSLELIPLLRQRLEAVAASEQPVQADRL